MGVKLLAWRNELCECVGVMILTASLATTSLSLDINTGSVFAGAMVLSLVYAIGTVSGAHINPIVSLGFYLTGRFSRSQLFRYIAAQVTGAIATTLLLGFVSQPVILPHLADWSTFWLEAILAGCLVFIILSVATSDCRLCPETRPIVGLVVGVAVAVLARWGGAWGVGLLNPLVLIMPSVFHLNAWTLCRVTVADLIGAIVAVQLFRFTRFTSPSDSSGDQR